MHGICHRCHRELPGASSGHAAPAGSAASDDERVMFCPWCGAPQILLPEHMRAEVAQAAGATTGTVPPPRPQVVDWSVIVVCAAPVALVTAILVAASFVSPAAGFLSMICILGAPGITLGLYRARRPLARIDGRVGLRVGLLTGLLMISGMGLALAGTGVVARYGLHNMAGFDDSLAKAQAAQQETGMALAEQALGTKLDDAEKQREIALMRSQEFRAGALLSGLFFQGSIVLILSTALGGLAGLLQTRRRALRS